MRARRKASRTSRPHGRRKRQGGFEHGPSECAGVCGRIGVVTRSVGALLERQFDGHRQRIELLRDPRDALPWARVVRSVDGIAARCLEHGGASQQVLVERAAQGLQAWRPGGAAVGAHREDVGQDFVAMEVDEQVESERLHATAHGGRLGRIRILAVPAAVEVGAARVRAQVAQAHAVRIGIDDDMHG